MIRYRAAACAALLCACSTSVEPIRTVSQLLTYAVGEGQWQSSSNLCLDTDVLAAGSIVRTQLCDPSKQTQHWTITSTQAGVGAWATSQALTNSGFVISGGLGQIAHLDAIPPTGLNAPQYAFGIDHTIVRRADQDACMASSAQGAQVLFTPCHHLTNQLWLGSGGYNVAIASGLQADSSGRPLYVQQDRGPRGHGALQLRQVSCATGTGSGTRCTPTVYQVFSLVPSVGSFGAAVHSGAFYWSSAGTGPVTFSTQPQPWVSNKWTWAIDPSSPGAGTTETAASNNTLCSVSPNSNGGALSMIDASTDLSFVRDCDWSFVYESQ